MTDKPHKFQRFFDESPWTRKALWCRIYGIPFNDRVEAGVISENEWMVRKCFGKMLDNNPWLESDILSNCHNAILDAARTWRPINGQVAINWTQWLRWKLLKACQNVIEHEHKHDNGNRCHSTDLSASSDTANTPSSNNSIDFLSESAGEAIKALPEPDKTIVWMTVVEGESIKRTAMYLRMPQKEVLAKKEAALEAMKQSILENSECQWAMADLNMNP